MFRVTICGLVKRLSVALVALALAGCNGVGSRVAPLRIVSDAALDLRAQRVVPSLRGDKTYFQYISNYRGDGLLQFYYPTLNSSIGTVNGVGKPLGECTKALYGTGDKTFWVAGSDGVYKFKVGTYPAGKLPDSNGVMSCAMDPNSGDLADVDLGSYINVYSPGSATPKTYGIGDTGVRPFFCGYDDKGNLFVDGKDRSLIGLVELPKGGDTFRRVTLPDIKAEPGAVQYDGKYLTVGDQTTIHQFEVIGLKAEQRGAVSLDGCLACWQTWIGRGVIFAPDLTGNTAYVFAYPQGGKPIATLSGSFAAPFGAVQVAQ
jgi:hypothetical protein